MWGVSLTDPVRPSSLCGEFVLHIPCCTDFYVRRFSYTAHAGFVYLFYLFFIWGVSLTHPVLVSFFIGGVSLTHPVLASFLNSGISLTHPVLALILSGEFLLHIPCWLMFFNLGSFSLTFHADFVFMWGVSLTYPVLLSLLYTFTHYTHLHIWGVSLTYPVLLSLLYTLYTFTHLGSFSYTFHADSVFVQGVSLTHRVLACFFVSGKFLLHIPCRLHFYLGSFS